MAVAGRMTDYFGLGLDLEQTNRIKEGAARRVVHPMETDFWKGEQLQASILFSLKEAFPTIVKWLFFDNILIRSSA